jgi:hypothetical protein
MPVESRGLANYSMNAKEMLGTLDAFYGNKDKSADIVDPEQYLSFVQWFDTVTWKLQIAGVPEVQWASAICQKLQGPMLKAFMARAKLEHWSFTHVTADELRVRMAQLFQNASVAYTKKALDMRFTANLAQSLQQFRNYCEQSCLNLDGNAFLYEVVRTKMTSAYPKCLVQAATEYQLTLSESEPSFSKYVDQAIKIAHKVQATKIEKLLDVPRMKRDVSPGRNASPRPASKKPKAAIKGNTFKEDANISVSDLCAKYGRCSSCAWKTEQDKPHKCEAEQQSVRIAVMRSRMRQGKNPNEFGNWRPKFKKSDAK